MDRPRLLPAMTDAPEPKDGDCIVLLVGDYDPPTLDYFRAIEALCKSKGIEGVWVCPVGSEDKQRVVSLATSFYADASSTISRRLTCCTVGLDKGFSPEDLCKWCQSKYPTLKFKVALLKDVSFAGEDGGVVKVSKFLRIGDVRDRIAEGSDESRSFTAGTWSLIQARRYYRSTPAEAGRREESPSDVD